MTQSPPDRARSTFELPLGAATDRMAVLRDDAGRSRAHTGPRADASNHPLHRVRGAIGLALIALGSAIAPNGSPAVPPTTARSTVSR